jgi:hypothetical protein
VDNAVATRLAGAVAGVLSPDEVTLTVAVTDLLESACDVALIVTLAGFGTDAGAV